MSESRLALVLAFTLAACGSSSSPSGTDAGTNTGNDTGSSTGTDTGSSTGTDTGGSTGTDAGSTPRTDAGGSTGTDAGSSTGTDAARIDTGATPMADPRCAATCDRIVVCEAMQGGMGDRASCVTSCGRNAPSEACFACFAGSGPCASACNQACADCFFGNCSAIMGPGDGGR